jgi:hypothetical protein
MTGLRRENRRTTIFCSFTEESFENNFHPSINSCAGIVTVDDIEMGESAPIKRSTYELHVYPKEPHAA